MHMAVRWDRLAFVNNLIKAGVSLTEEDDHQQQPLHLACSRGNLAVLQALFNSLMQPNRLASEKAAIQARDRKGYFCLHLAARRKGSLKFIRMLAKEICINAENRKGQTCLMVAAKAGKVKNVKYILNSYANHGLLLPCSLAWAGGKYGAATSKLITPSRDRWTQKKQRTPPPLLYCTKPPEKSCKKKNKQGWSKKQRTS